MSQSEKILEAVAHAKFKVEWAKQHINGVKQLVHTIIADNPNVVSVENDPQAAFATVRIGPKTFIPVSLPLHLGDAIHALNSVMDFLWSGLARCCDANLASKITFPRDETRKNLEARFNTGRDAAIQKFFPQAKPFVLDVVQPYKRDDTPSYIWRLNKLDNINKHRLLITTPHIISFRTGLVLEGADGGQVVLAPEACIQTQGHPMTIGLTAPVTIMSDPQPTVDVVFGEPDHFTGEPIVERLLNLVEATTEVVEAFEKEFI